MLNLGLSQGFEGDASIEMVCIWRLNFIDLALVPESESTETDRPKTTRASLPSFPKSLNSTFKSEGHLLQDGGRG